MKEIVELAKMMGVRYSISGSNCMISCPNAPVSPAHHFGRDNHPSFGILASETEASRCNCFCCYERGASVNVFRRFRDRGVVNDDIVRYVLDRDGMTAKVMLSRLNSRIERRSNSQEKPLENLNFGESFCRDRSADPYLLWRGITQEEIYKYRLGCDFSSARATFPTYSLDGHYCGCTGRTLINDGSKYRRYPEPPGQMNGRVLFGEHVLDLSTGNVILCEGPVDAIVVSRYLKNALALNGDVLSPLKLERLLVLARSVTLMLDGDTAGQNGMKELYAKLSPRIRTFLAPLPKGKDPAEMTQREICDSFAKKFSFFLKFS